MKSFIIKTSKRGKYYWIKIFKEKIEQKKKKKIFKNIILNEKSRKK
jgi:predicted RNA-binding protein YlxR (DUF448 family)